MDDLTTLKRVGGSTQEALDAYSMLSNPAVIPELGMAVKESQSKDRDFVPSIGQSTSVQEPGKIDDLGLVGSRCIISFTS